MRSRCGCRAFRASPIRCVGERIMATGVPEFREVAWRACVICYLAKGNVALSILMTMASTLCAVLAMPLLLDVQVFSYNWAKKSKFFRLCFISD
ncbi:hypothetical protein [Bathymodiolus japonicus methanotrophic gill symbiont]|uniref:hypothetical protein n=1 Tax=Bathymodiolus japonicus methanotrophic gill symbiont TaxID=113269 RepID=UPI003B833F17